MSGTVLDRADDIAHELDAKRVVARPTRADFQRLLALGAELLLLVREACAAWHAVRAELDRAQVQAPAPPPRRAVAVDVLTELTVKYAGTPVHRDLIDALARVQGTGGEAVQPSSAHAAEIPWAPKRDLRRGGAKLPPLR